MEHIRNLGLHERQSVCIIDLREGGQFHANDIENIFNRILEEISPNLQKEKPI